MGVSRFPLPRKNFNLPLPFFIGDWPILLLQNIHWSFYMYINWFTFIIFINDRIFYTKTGGNEKFSRFSQHNGKLPLPRSKQGNCRVIFIYDPPYILSGESNHVQISIVPDWNLFAYWFLSELQTLLKPQFPTTVNFW